MSNVVVLMLVFGLGVHLVIAGVTLTIAIAVQAGDILHFQTAVAGQQVGTVIVGMSNVVVLMLAFRLGVHLVTAGVTHVITITIAMIHGNTNQFTTGALVLVLGFADGYQLMVGTGMCGCLVLISTLVAGAIAMFIGTFALKDPPKHSFTAVRTHNIVLASIVRRIFCVISIIMRTLIFCSHSSHGDYADDHCQSQQHSHNFLIHF